jgi:hypothetical protein
MNRDLHTSHKSQIEYEILAYLVEHPEARDTLEGIAAWWLLEQEIKFQLTQVRETLAELVARGLVCEKIGRDSRIHYSLNQGKYEEIQKLFNRKNG